MVITRTIQNTVIPAEPRTTSIRVRVCVANVRRIVLVVFAAHLITRRRLSVWCAMGVDGVEELVCMDNRAAISTVFITTPQSIT